MMSDKNLRANLVELLRGGGAHTTIAKALEGIDPKTSKSRPQGAEHSPWEILEHMRLAQEDILRYTLDPRWVSPEFPAGYWPANPEPLTEADWHESVAKFLADLEETITLVESSSLDLLTEIPHGEGRTYLREILLIADHNAYHLGQIIQIRKLVGDWSA
jgi:hypothetical protein